MTPEENIEDMSPGERETFVDFWEPTMGEAESLCCDDPDCRECQDWRRGIETTRAIIEILKAR